jgi:GDP-L-fucose synthase
MRVLLTGATGTLGRNLMDHPLRREHEVLTPGRRDHDLLDPAAVRRMFADLRPEAVIHAAATVGGIQDNIDHPVRFLVENTMISVNVIHEARRAGVETLLNIASSCMYPRNVSGALAPPLLLTAPLEPTNEGYALAKITSWKLVEYLLTETPELRYRTLIPCNLFGPYDNFHPLYSHMLQAAIVKTVAAVERGEDEVLVWGDGRARREFMLHADFADFIWTFLPRAAELPSAINVGVGVDHTVTEYYEAAARCVGFAGRFVYDPSRPHGMERKLLDVSAQRALGWSPRHTLDEGIALTVDYYRANRQADPRRERPSRAAGAPTPPAGPRG